MRLGLVVGALGPLSGCLGVYGPGTSATQPPAGDNGPAATASLEDMQDAELGMRENPHIIATYGGVYHDHAAEMLIAGIVSSLLAASEQPTQKYTVTILDTADVNAFALPGGYIYVTRGILALANDSSEIAAVLGHEMGHVILHHARARTQKLRSTELVDQVVTNVLGKNAASDAVAQDSRASFAAFSQAQELAADQEGIRILGKAGFDPYAAARFLGVMGRFSTFSAGDASQQDDFLSTHPSTPDRIAKANAAAQAMYGPRGAGEQDRTDYMAAIDGMNFGPSASQGAILGQRFIQPGLRITFTVPEGYRLQIAQGAVVAVAGDGEAVRFDTASVPPSMALADYLKSGWIAGLKPASVTSRTVNGIDTASGVAVTDQWSFRVSVMRVDGDVYRFIFAAKADSPRFAAGAQETLESFRRATPRDIAAIRHPEIKVITAASGDTADTLARRMADFSKGRELFYVLNDLYPGDPVTPGQKYKIITVD
jgi:predicted Zn-dependent protease